MQANHLTSRIEEQIGETIRRTLDVTPPTTEEIGMVIRQIMSGRAVVPDNIPVESLKSDMEVIVDMLHVLSRKIWEEEKVPID
ncbi:unnamed protein product [Schistosoma curassoni]|uniref:DUF768 domain-containing protein n=1 Tax=Schistosoma curassoni TaxID=6186 RepID=A0A183K284_9TREM|nr:unnamed protein product [Schistosoma curassoni]